MRKLIFRFCQGGGLKMDLITSLQKTIVEQKELIKNIENNLINIPEELRVGQERILQLLREELVDLEEELLKYLL